MKQQRTLFIHIDTEGNSPGRVWLAETNIAGMQYFDHVVCLGSQVVEIDVPEFDLDAYRVQSLQKKHAAAQKAADEIGAQISGLLEVVE